MKRKNRDYSKVIGKTFGKLSVLARTGAKNGNVLLLCRCTCGVEKEISASSVLRKNRSQKSCGCKRHGKPYESLYNYCMFHAQREHPELKHDLTYDEFLDFVHEKYCHYCERQVYFVARNINGERAIRYNLDRKRNTKGYTKKNLVVCCKICNYTKGNRFSYSQMVQLGKLIKNFKLRCS